MSRGLKATIITVLLIVGGAILSIAGGFLHTMYPVLGGIGIFVVVLPIIFFGLRGMVKDHIKEDKQED